MNQLSITLLKFVGSPPAGDAVRRPSAAIYASRRLRAGALTCRWRLDPVTGRLNCAWSALKGAREAQPPLRLSLAS